MTRQLKPSILILAILFYPESNVEADTYQNTDDGFCLKSEDGVKCMSNDDVTLTRLESQQVLKNEQGLDFTKNVLGAVSRYFLEQLLRLPFFLFCFVFFLFVCLFLTYMLI